MSQVFISYARLDGSLVKPIAERIESAGHKVWLDKSTIPGGAAWQEEIIRGIERADVFLLMMSPSALSSENVEREVGLAYSAGISISPVMLCKTAVPANLEYALCGLEILDVSAPSVEDASQRILAHLGSPKARIRFKNLVASRTQRRIYALLMLAILAVALLWDRTGLVGWLNLGALVMWWIWVLGGRYLFWWLVRSVLSIGIARRGTTITTKLKGFSGGFPLWIVTEWTDPVTSKGHEFYSSPIWWNAQAFVPNQLQVIIDRRNPRVYRMDLSFMPREMGGAIECSDASVPARTCESGTIFLSHSDDDSEVAKTVARQLSGAGYQVWLGTQFYDDESSSEEKIVAQIQQAESFLLVLSDRSTGDTRVRRELDVAISYGKRIVAASASRIDVPTQMNYALTGAEFVDLSRDLKSGLVRLLDIVAANPKQSTIRYRPRNLPAPVRIVFTFFGQALQIMVVLPVLALCALPGAWVARRLPMSVRAWLSRRWDSLRMRLGIWTDSDLRTRGTVLLTDYKTFETENDMFWLIAQWRDPATNALYRFRGGPLARNPRELVKTKKITVYVNPENLTRYCMDLSFLLKKQNKNEKTSPEATGPISDHSIFLSYCRADGAKVDLLSGLLQREGYEILDPHKNGDCERWDERIREVIESATSFLILAPSGTSVDFGLIREELRAASSFKRRIVPVTFGSFEVAPSMHYALAGLQCIDMSDFEAGSARLLEALGDRSQKHPEPSVASSSARYRPHTRLQRAGLGALSWIIGSELAAIVFDRNSMLRSALVSGALAGLLAGGTLGALYKQRLKKSSAIPIGIFAWFLQFLLIYLPIYSILGISSKAGGFSASLFFGPMLGYAFWVAGKKMQDRAAVRRLRSQGHRLLTEFQSLTNDHVVSAWRNPETDEVHTFQSDAVSWDPSAFVGTTSIPVFVNPSDLSEYFMDLSSSDRIKK